MSPWTAGLHELFLAGPWTTVAIGDGGNEIGMGSLPRALIARHIDNGPDIACTVAADHLIVAGVSNWACYALAGAFSVLRPDWRAAMLGVLDEHLNDAVLTAMVERGPAVDGRTRQQALTVDGFKRDVHAAKIAAIRALATAA